MEDTAKKITLKSFETAIQNPIYVDAEEFLKACYERGEDDEDDIIVIRFNSSITNEY